MPFPHLHLQKTTNANLEVKHQVVRQQVPRQVEARINQPNKVSQMIMIT